MTIPTCYFLDIVETAISAAIMNELLLTPLKIDLLPSIGFILTIESSLPIINYVFGEQLWKLWAKISDVSGNLLRSKTTFMHWNVRFMKYVHSFALHSPSSIYPLDVFVNCMQKSSRFHKHISAKRERFSSSRYFSFT